MTIQLDTHNPAWSAIFAQEKQRLSQGLGDGFGIHHCGSTAIVDIKAKPVIDIVIEYPNYAALDGLEEKLIRLGYIPWRRNVTPVISFITSRDGELTYHLHIHPKGDPQVVRHLQYCEYLNANPDDAKAYEKLKCQLAGKFDNTRDYAIAKTAFVHQMDAKIRQVHFRQSKYTLCKDAYILPATADRQEIVDAIVVNFMGRFTYYPQYMAQYVFDRQPMYTFCQSDFMHDAYNYVVDVHLPEDGIEIIHNLNARFGDRPFIWWLDPSSTPQNIHEQMLAAGCYVDRKNNTMFRLLDREIEVIPDNITIKRALEADDFQSLTDFYPTPEPLAHFQSMPIDETDPIEYYIAYYAGEPVCLASLVLYGGVAGLYDLYTKQEMRGRGFAKAIQNYRLQRAKSLGYEIAVLLATPGVEALHLKQGFESICAFYQYKSREQKKGG